MTTETKTTITALAGAAFQEYASAAEVMGDELSQKAFDELLGFARGDATRRLGEDAARLLDWRFTGTAHLPDDTLEATAVLEEGPNYLRYRQHEDTVTFELVQPCNACGHNEIGEVRDLATLGGLLEVARWQERGL